MSTPTPNAQNPYAPPSAPGQDLTDTTGPGDLAERSSRLGAYLLDIVMLCIVYGPAIVGALPRLRTIMMAAAQPGGAANVSRMEIYRAYYVGNPYILITAVLFLVWAVVTILLVVRNGQSIGKRIVGIKVVRTNGQKASFWRIFLLRNVVNAIPSLIPIVSYVYWLVDTLVIFGESRQCLHDKIASTVVVKA
jgi:uncharacterized RDD family membrane protein YckC